MGVAKLFWEIEGERMADEFINGKITEIEYRGFLQRHLGGNRWATDEADQIIDALKEDRDGENGQ